VDAIVSADSSGRLLTWNSGAERLFGWTAGEVVGKPLTVIIPGRFRALHEEGIARVRRSGVSRLAGQVVELAGQRRDGREIPIELPIGSWTGPDGLAFSGVLRDIGERKRAEAALAAANRSWSGPTPSWRPWSTAPPTTSRARWCRCSATSSTCGSTTATPSARRATTTWTGWPTAPCTCSSSSTT
jgi:PAS domain S-box-containing protein